jgi:hypothetical protein
MEIRHGFHVRAIRSFNYLLLVPRKRSVLNTKPRLLFKVVVVLELKWL